jgi:hypothetical protein
MAGGARIGAGRTPDPNALRRDRKDDAGWTVLPAEGRKGKKPPSFPLIDPTAREMQLWRELWKKPQAIVWEKNGQEMQVAMYTRTFAEAEIIGAHTNLRTLLRQQANELLLTLPALLSARVRIAEDEVAAKRTQAKVEPAKNSARDRLKAVNGA